MQPSRRTLLAAVLLLATVAGTYAQSFVDDSAFLSGDYGFAGGYYGSYTDIPTYLDVPTYTTESPAPLYGYYSYGYDVLPSYTAYGYGSDIPTYLPTPTYYYTTAPPTNPTFYYTPSETTSFGYYYTAPAPYFTTPSYYPTTYSYAAPAFYYATPSVAPATCPPCPSCSATYVPSTSASASASAPAAGTCYCPYDSDWKTWAVADPTCRTALYAKCKADSRLACTWLDQYYSAATTYTRPFEQQIFAFLYSDCAPAPPCACAPLTFTASDSPAQVYTCCRQLQTYSQIPYSGLSQSVTDAFCSSGARAADVKAWVTHALWHATCPAAATTSSAVFTTAPAASPSPSPSSASVAKSAATAPVSSIQQETSSVQSAADRRAKRRRAAVATAAAAVGGAVGGALFAAGVALVVLHLRRPRHQGTYQAFV